MCCNCGDSDGLCREFATTLCDHPAVALLQPSRFVNLLPCAEWKIVNVSCLFATEFGRATTCGSIACGRRSRSVALSREQLVSAEGGLGDGAISARQAIMRLSVVSFMR